MGAASRTKNIKSKAVRSEIDSATALRFVNSWRILEFYGLAAGWLSSILSGTDFSLCLKINRNPSIVSAEWLSSALRAFVLECGGLTPLSIEVFRGAQRDNKAPSSRRTPKRPLWSFALALTRVHGLPIILVFERAFEFRDTRPLQQAVLTHG